MTSGVPPPPLRNGVSLYTSCSQAVQQLSPNQPQPILRLGVSRTDTTTDLTNLANCIMLSHHQSIYGQAVVQSPAMSHTPHQHQDITTTFTYPDLSPHSSMNFISAMISPSSRPPPAYEDVYKQQQPQSMSAWAPRHVMSGGQPQTRPPPRPHQTWPPPASTPTNR